MGVIDRDCRLSASAVVEAASSDGLLLLKPRAGCAGCGASCLWKRLGTMRLPSPNHAEFAPGDRVEVSLPAGYALHAACVAYGLPLVGLLGGAALAAWIDAGDGPVFAGALAGLATAFLTTAGIRRRVERAVLTRCTITKPAGSEC